MNNFVFTGRDEAPAAWGKGRVFSHAMAAQSANRAETEFLAAISHELRPPLTSIRGFAELMERRIEHPVFREQAGLIRKGAEHLNTLLTEILDMTRIEAGAMPIVPKPQDLRQLVTGVGEFFEVAAAAKGLALDAQVAADVPQRVQRDQVHRARTGRLPARRHRARPGAVALAGRVDGRTTIAALGARRRLDLHLCAALSRHRRAIGTPIRHAAGGRPSSLARRALRSTQE